MGAQFRGVGAFGGGGAPGALGGGDMRAFDITAVIGAGTYRPGAAASSALRAALPARGFSVPPPLRATALSPRQGPPGQKPASPK